METEDFPRPFKIGPAAIAWRADELDTWIKSRPRKGASNSRSASGRRLHLQNNPDLNLIREDFL
jgi:hypothetical protein